MPPDVPVVIPPRDAQRHVIHRPALPDLLEPYSFNSLADFRTLNLSLYLVYHQARDITGEELGVLPQDISYTFWDKAYRRIFKEADPSEQDDRETATSLRGKSQRRSRIAKMLTLRPKESLVDSTESSAGEDDEADENNGDDEGGAPPDKGKQRMADPDAVPVIPALASPMANGKPCFPAVTHKPPTDFKRPRPCWSSGAPQSITPLLPGGLWHC